MSSSAKAVVRERKLDVEWVRQQFPSLHQAVNGQPAVFFDSPGGTQAPQRVIDAMAAYLSTSNANSGGAFATSQRTDGGLLQLRQR
jgi:selenocysteine lyase/cysteine desulfurase